MLTSEEINFRKKFKARFNQLRDGMTQGKFAEFLGISRPTVGFYENGDRIPDAFGVRNIADKCGVPADWLLALSDFKNSDTRKLTAEDLGLTESSAAILSNYFKRDKKNSLTLTINKLIENEEVIGAISRFLYYDLKSDGELVKYVYRFIDECSDASKGAIWGETPTAPIDISYAPEFIDKKIFRRLMLLRVQEQLDKLLDSETTENPFIND